MLPTDLAPPMETHEDGAPNRAPMAPLPSPRRPGDTSVPLRSHAHARWSPTRFHIHRDLTDEEVTALMEAARWAPSTYGEEPWRFIVARRRDPWRQAVEAALVPGNAWARDASVLVVGMTSNNLSRNGKENRMATHDLGIALGGILGEATSRGLATHPMGGFRSDAIRTAFQVPDEVDIRWVLAVGHYDPRRDDPELSAKDARPRRRRPLRETVFGPRYGVSPER